MGHGNGYLPKLAAAIPPGPMRRLSHLGVPCPSLCQGLIRSPSVAPDRSLDPQSRPFDQTVRSAYARPVGNVTQRHERWLSLAGAVVCVVVRQDEASPLRVPCPASIQLPPDGVGGHFLAGPAVTRGALQPAHGREGQLGLP